MALLKTKVRTSWIAEPANTVNHCAHRDRGRLLKVFRQQRVVQMVVLTTMTPPDSRLPLLGVIEAAGYDNNELRNRTMLICSSPETLVAALHAYDLALRTSSMDPERMCIRMGMQPNVAGSANDRVMCA